MIRRPPRSTPFPYTTSSRSSRGLRRTSVGEGRLAWLGGEGLRRPAERAPDAIDHRPDSRGTAGQVHCPCALIPAEADHSAGDRKSTRLNSSHANISYAVFCL